MHPGGKSLPGDPNAAFCIDGVYHLHYISAASVEGWAVVFFRACDEHRHAALEVGNDEASAGVHGARHVQRHRVSDERGASRGDLSWPGLGRNQIAIAKDGKLTEWEKPFAVDVRNADGTEAKINHWDPDCFLVGDTYFAISGGENPPLFESKDMKTWTLVGDFLAHDMPDVARGEDISCPNFFRIGDKWMLLCISHDLGCRYYIGQFDERTKKFVPEKHARMNWRRENQSLFSRESWRVDFFAPESVLTPDGRRVMWAWCSTIDRTDGKMSEIDDPIAASGVESVRRRQFEDAANPELETLRYEPSVREDFAIDHVDRTLLVDRSPKGQNDRGGERFFRIRITIDRKEAERKLFGFTVFADGQGGGLPIVFRPETGALRLGTTEAPFSIADLPPGEDVTLRIFVDRHIVEVIRQ